MTFLRREENEYGTGESWFKCDTCGTEYSVCPAPDDEKMEDWNNCMGPDCASYDPHRDADVLFMSNAEIAKEKKIVSIQKLRERRIGP